MKKKVAKPCEMPKSWEDWLDILNRSLPPRPERKEVRKMPEIHKIKPEHAARMWDWLQSRGGIAIWRSINLSNPGASWSSPALTDGKPTPKPTWQCANEPERIITDPAEVHVTVPREVKRFRIALRVGSQGLMVKLTDGSSNRVREAVARAEEKYKTEAWYEFDYEMQEAVIYVEANSIPLAEWVAVPPLPSTETVADKGAVV